MSQPFFLVEPKDLFEAFYGQLKTKLLDHSDIDILSKNYLFHDLLKGRC